MDEAYDTGLTCPGVILLQPDRDDSTPVMLGSP